MGFKKRLKKGW